MEFHYINSEPLLKLISEAKKHYVKSRRAYCLRNKINGAVYIWDFPRKKNPQNKKISGLNKIYISYCSIFQGLRNFFVAVKNASPYTYTLALETYLSRLNKRN